MKFSKLIYSFSYALIVSTTVSFLNASDLQDEADVWHQDRQQPSEGISLGELKGNNRSVAAAGRMSRDGDPVNEHTPYEIGSITKVFTGILLSDTVLRGKASLDDSIGRHLPEDLLNEDSPLQKVTLLQLSAHTSGLPRLPGDLGVGSDGDDPYAHYSRERLFNYLKEFEEEDLESPGTYSYSNLGVGLLGEVLAIINDTDYETLLKERILGPLDMDSTWVQRNIESEPIDLKDRFATGHSGGEPRSNWRLASLVGAGGMVSSVTDMLNFAEAHWAEDTPEYLKKAFALAMEKHSQRTGLGWHLRESAFTHGGGTGGFRTELSIKPGEQYAKVSLRNSSGESTAIVRRGDFSEIVGYWSGSLDTGNRVLRMVMHITEDGSASQYSIDQGGSPISSSKVSFEDSAFVAHYPGINGIYKATLEDGKLSGTWMQGRNLSLDMEFSSEMPQALAEVFERAYTGNLEPLIGFWEGRIGDDENGLFVYIEVSKIANRFIAKLWSPTQTPHPLGVSKFSISENKIQFESRRINGTYKGILDLSTKEITGTWSQGTETPLNLTWSEARPEVP